MFLPCNIAINKDNINTSDDYIIVKLSTATDEDFNIIYDSMNRNLIGIKDDSRLKNRLLNFKGFCNDYMGNLNEYVLYTQDDEIEHTPHGDILHINTYKINIIYPVKRDDEQFFYPKWCVFNYEKIFDFF